MEYSDWIITWDFPLKFVNTFSIVFLCNEIKLVYRLKQWSDILTPGAISTMVVFGMNWICEIHLALCITQFPSQSVLYCIFVPCWCHIYLYNCKMLGYIHLTLPQFLCTLSSYSVLLCYVTHKGVKDNVTQCKC